MTLKRRNQIVCENLVVQHASTNDRWNKFY